MPGRKKAVTLIIEGMGGNGPIMGPEDDYEYALKSCGSKIMECMERKDVEGFCEYMKDFIEMCEDNPKPKRPMMDMEY